MATNQASQESATWISKGVLSVSKLATVGATDAPLRGPPEEEAADPGPEAG